MYVLRIIGKNLENYFENGFDIKFIATDKVSENDELQQVYKSIYLQNLMPFVGVNASGKTRTLKMIEFILKILFDKKGLNESSSDGIIPCGIINKTEFIVYFIEDNIVYEWKAVISVNEENGIKKLSYYEEELKAKSVKSVKNRKNLFDFSDITEVQKRSTLSKDILEMMKDDSSITIRISRKEYERILSLTDITNINIMAPIGNIPQEVVNLLDPSIEYLSCKAEMKNFKCSLKFRDDDKIFDLKNYKEINDLLSSGTIKGNFVFYSAIITLIKGGYLIIDEIENHFHKELVKLLLNLFKSKKTNPNGAIIIFSTHYAEILDSIKRKDNIYILNKIKNDIKISNYSEYVKRNDLKKSDVYLSGIIEGTTPKYENVKMFQEFLCKNVLKSE